MAPLIKVTYFNYNALAEPIRWLLKYGNTDFEDYRFPNEEWLNIKPATPFGQVPLYEEGGRTINQSVAVSRYLGKKAHLSGESDWEDLEIDSIVDTICDLMQKLRTYSYEKNEELKKSLKEPVIDNTLPYYLERLDKIAQDNNGYLALKKLTWADFYFIGMLEYFNWMAEKDILEKYPNLTAVKKNVYQVPAVKDWIAKRPTTLF